MLEKLQTECLPLFQGGPFLLRMEVLKTPENTPSKVQSRLLQGQVRQELEKFALGATLYTSISHTDWGGERVMIVGGSLQPLGVDLENCNRPIHPRLSLKMIAKEEQHFALNPLEFWVIKEAAFKAFPSNSGTYVSQYRVVQWDPGKREGKVQLCHMILGGPCIRFKLFAWRSWFIAIATGG